jgi:hypothetical protein
VIQTHYGELHPTTEPAYIRAQQRCAVRGAIENLGSGATIEAISEYTVLPVWNVKRALAELLETRPDLPELVAAIAAITG